MATLFVSVIVASLLGSLHCLGMCGGLVAVYAARRQADRRVSWLPHLTYHGGRLVSYVTLGAIVGSLGAVVDLAGTMVNLAHAAAWIAGALMVLIGGVLLLQLSGWQMSRFPFLARVTRWQSRLIQRLKGRPPVVRAGALGVLSALLPCGWLYAFVVTAAATASPLQGGLLMLAFWLGTVPALLGLGLAVNSLSVTIRRAIPWVGALTILCVGMVTIWYRSQLPIPWATTPHAVVHSTAPSTLTPPKEPSCHGH